MKSVSNKVLACASLMLVSVSIHASADQWGVNHGTALEIALEIALKIALKIPQGVTHGGKATASNAWVESATSPTDQIALEGALATDEEQADSAEADTMLA